MSWLSSLWDDITGKSQVQSAIDAQTALNAQNMGIQQQALAKQDEWTKAAMALQKEQYDQALQEQQANTANQLRLSGLNTAGNLMGQQMSQDQAIQQMLMNQAENRSTNMARQAAVQQAMPALLSMLGLSPVSVGNGYTEANPTVLGRNLLSELGTYNQAVQPMVSGMGGLGAGAAGAGATAIMPTSMAASTTTPYSMSNFNVNNLLNASPTYQFQLKQAEDAIKRSLAARGGLNSSEYTAQMANQAGNLATNETDKIYNRLASLVNYGAGGSLNASSYNQLPSTNLSNISTDLSNTLNQAATNRSNLMSSYGQNMGNAYQNYGNQLSSGMQSMGNLGYNQGVNMGQLNQQLGQTSGLGGFLGGLSNLGSGLSGVGNTWNQLSRLFGGNKSSSAGGTSSAGDFLNAFTGANTLGTLGKTALGWFGA